MKNIFAFMLAVLVSFSLQAQNTETRKLSSFDRVAVGQSIKLILEQGNERSARIETSGVDTDKVVTDVSSGNLNIQMAKGNYRNTRVTVYLSYSDKLEGIRASSSASIQSENKVVSDELSIKVSSSAKVNLEVEANELDVRMSSSGKADLNINVENLDVDISSSAKLDLSGRTNFQRFNISSSGKMYAYDLSSTKVRGDVSSSGSAEVSVSNEIIADASSSGKITYRGNPEKVIVDSNSSGKVRKAN